ncbi:hypothetical protein HYFRA_00005801 [Hymenoscyphus fraxineus]|uniref:CRAL-TRIO domain-containing protein n=1 Tax=Hymenoscyphus fraxineus TaxID=746836 RepID=A0A9N9KW45_9HELO|nr:hypothetical protein HYFRA_00005801 [Hymenoscyphus fraxineus]
MKTETIGILFISRPANLRNHIAPTSVLRLSTASNLRCKRSADLTQRRNQSYNSSTFTQVQHRYSLRDSLRSTTCQNSLQSKSLSHLRVSRQPIYSIKTSGKPFTAHPKPPAPLQRGYSSWSAVAIVSFFALLYAYFPDDSKRYKEERYLSSDSKAAPEVLQIEEFYEYIMAQENQVGRVGNLTPEQEEKLKLLWIATLRVFGIAENEVAEVDDSVVKEEAGDGKKPKKKRSLFRRSGKDSAVTKSESGPATPPGSGEDDKYGQTKEFHDALASQSPESLRATFWGMVKHDHPDALLLRFLRARKWDVDRALIMMISTMKWRSKDVHVDDDLVKNGELQFLQDANSDDPARKKMGEDFLSQMRMGKSFFHGLDNEGRPMCFVRARLHKQGEQSEESLEKYTVFTIEIGRMVVMPPVDTACIIFDLTGFSMANMDYGPVKFMIKCFEANYPESLGVVIVHKAPWIFQGIWKIIRGWLDPVVASKVHFTNNNLELEEFVPRSNIIKELGGDEDWEYKYIEPSPTENDLMKDTATRDKLLAERENTVKEFEKATTDWIALAAADATKAKEERSRLATSLKDGYWVLDPYVRARSYYDRVGLIKKGERPVFYPQRAEVSPTPVVATAPPAVNGAKPAETSQTDLN